MTDRWPDLGVLELLVAVAERGSLGAAAQQVGVSQPAASQALARFERRLGLTLLERTNRGSQVTREGALVVDWSRAVLEAAGQLRLATEALRSERVSQLQVAASMTVAEYLVPRWLGEFRRRHSGVETRLAVLNSEQVLDAVRSHTAHVGFIETSASPTGLQSRAVAGDVLEVVVAPGHPWSARGRPLTGAELARTPLVLRERGSGTRQALEAAVAALGLHLSAPAQELASNAAVRVAAIAGTAPAVLSELAVAEALAAGQLVRVPVSGLDLRRGLRAVWAGSATPVGQVADFLAATRAGA